jgi:hypothetical protein
VFPAVFARRQNGFVGAWIVSWAWVDETASRTRTDEASAFGWGIRRLRARVGRRAEFINLRFEISRFPNQDGSKLRIGGFPGELEQRRHLTHEILPA